MKTLCLIWLLLIPSLALGQSDPPGALVLQAVRVEPDNPAMGATALALLGWDEGQHVDVDDLVGARRVLQESGYFTKVDVYTERGSRPGAVVLVVEGEWDRSPQIESGFGHEPLTGWYLNVVGVRWNSYAGRGGHVRAGMRLGLRTSMWYTEARWPRLFHPKLDLLADLSAGANRWWVVDREDAWVQEIGQGEARLGLRYRFHRNLDATLWAGSQVVEPENQLKRVGSSPPAGIREYLPLSDGPDRYQQQQLVVRLRTDRPGERWRNDLAGAVRFTALQQTDRTNSTHFAAELKGAMPLFSRDALAVRGTVFQASDEAPYYHRGVFGGVGSLRGYRDAALSGPLGARGYWLVTAEWRRALMKASDGSASVVGQFFVDSGRHWDADNVDQGGSTSVGYGLRIRVPWLQVFGLDVGIPVDRRFDELPFWVHASLGFNF